jgi:hypothetical protein
VIPEHFLREIWKAHEQFLVAPLLLADGSPLTVLDHGKENEHRGGPDFLSARIVIDGLAISGDVELHITSSGWQDHGHHEDARYGSVVLHVVLEHDDEDAARMASPRVPTLVLANNLALEHTAVWEALFRKMYDRSPELPCFPHNLLVPMRMKRKALESFGEARLDELVDRVAIQDSEIVSESQLLERVYQLTMDALGYSQNRQPFRELSSLLPLERLRHVRKEFPDDTRLAFEALYLGVAGLLETPSNDFEREANEYLIDLHARWNTVQVTLSIPETLAESDWAFFRIRPANSPRRRLALAALLAEKYFSRDSFDFRDEFFLKGPQVATNDSPFWERHSSFSAPALPSAHSLLGDERSPAIWLNVILPARIAKLRLSGETRAEKGLRVEWGDPRTRSSAEYLEIIRQELLEGESVVSVRSEQGALLLKRNFCERQRCSECPVGNRLIEKGWKPQGASQGI